MSPATWPACLSRVKKPLYEDALRALLPEALLCLPTVLMDVVVGYVPVPVQWSHSAADGVHFAVDDQKRSVQLLVGKKGSPLHGAALVCGCLPCAPPL
jgi:hypothetical protein